MSGSARGAPKGGRRARRTDYDRSGLRDLPDLLVLLHDALNPRLPPQERTGTADAADGAGRMRKMAISRGRGERNHRMRTGKQGCAGGRTTGNLVDLFLFFILGNETLHL